MKLALDTNAYTAFCKNDSVVVDAIQRAERVILPVVVLAELRSGFSLGRRGDENEAVLQRFLGSSRVEVACPDEGTTFINSRLYAYLRKKGTPIPLNDLWIASIVIQNDSMLLTFDDHFALLPQVPRWI